MLTDDDCKDPNSETEHDQLKSENMEENNVEKYTASDKYNITSNVLIDTPTNQIKEISDKKNLNTYNTDNEFLNNEAIALTNNQDHALDNKVNDILKKNENNLLTNKTELQEAASVPLPLDAETSLSDVQENLQDKTKEMLEDAGKN